MISLLTGKPGAGKTNHMVKIAMEEIAKGRPVYVCNIRGVKIPGAIEVDHPSEWENLPTGALLVVDEAQRFWRANRNGNVPPEVHALETHRHLGIDLLLATQEPTYLLKHLRGLIGHHVHHVRRSKKVIQTLTWQTRCSDDPESNSEQELSEQGVYTLHMPAFQFYESTEQDTHKPKIPRKVLFIGAAVVLFLFLIIFGPDILTRLTVDATSRSEAVPSAQPPGLPADGLAQRGGRSRPATVEEYAQVHAPRVGEAPWSAPVFDQRTASSDPRLWCMSSDPGTDANGKARQNSSCSCITEQGTKYQMELTACMVIARTGGMYNPYALPVQPQMAQPSPAQQPQQQAPRVASVAGTSGQYGAVAQYGDYGIETGRYEARSLR